ncbi:nuclease HARBI1 [Entomortierella parvispora]|uniref:Nuclease HARBI1 n=1 Tax=Entomortierella parvispora TaxID=205924 RepID=A0A9P3H815_9FUNG|nr:nuclease HARBI1 [Entomortierella parvispora]GJJ71503.1 nuclease HARBI1 [Entomortierella parvispora]
MDDQEQIPRIFPYDEDNDEEDNEEDDDEDIDNENEDANNLDGQSDSDEEIVFLMGMANDFIQHAARILQRRNRNPPVPFAIFNLNQYDNITSERLFRFRTDEILDIVEALRVPNVLVLDNGSKFSSLEGVCIVLRRLAFPCRLVDLMPMFGRSEGMLSRIFNKTITWIYNRWARQLFTWDHARLTPAKLEQFAAVIREAGSPLQDVVGFIDGTVRPIARPMENQRQEYNGHHRVHAMKFQAVTTPDGIVVHLSGPYHGKQHDTAMYRISRLQDTLLERVKDVAGNNMCIFGDQGYELSPVLQVAFPGRDNELTAGQRAFNKAMAEVRIAVEWSFGHTLQYFSFTELKKTQRSLLSALHVQYTISVLFANLHSCITQKNASVGKFGLSPPTLEEYLHD